ncbi:MAG: hypothetical protein LBR21_01980, partial [Propionibacteriaceae bacterium]|nr:hypothetical protein [Propionibacteriaceae bacterium]
TVRDLTEPAANTRQAGIVFWGTQSVGYQTCAAANGYTTAKVRVPVAIDGKLKTLLDQGTAVGDENTKLGVKLGSSDDKGTFRQMTGTAYGNQFVLKNGDVLLWGDADNSGSGTYNHVDTASCSDAPEVTQIVDSNLDSKPKRPIVSVTNGDGWVLLLDATGQAHWYGKRSLAHMLPDKDGNPISTNGGYDFDDPQQITGSNGKMSGGWKWGCSEAWVEGGIEKLTGFGSSVMIKRTNGNFYIAGGSVSGHPGNNEHRIVRDSLQGTTYYSDQYATLVAQPVVP